LRRKHEAQWADLAHPVAQSTHQVRDEHPEGREPADEVEFGLDHVLGGSGLKDKADGGDQRHTLTWESPRVRRH
jgi:hypothetical protein